MRYDRGYGRDRGAARGYDSGLRGFLETARRREPIPLREEGGRSDDWRTEDYRGEGSTPRVTRSYNRDYVQRDTRPRGYDPYGGDRPERIVGPGDYQRPYMTVGGTRTMRGGGRPLGWEREAGRGGYDRGFRGYGRDLYGPLS